MQEICKKHNSHKGQEPLPEWEEHHEWLAVKAREKAKIDVVELECCML